MVRARKISTNLDNFASYRQGKYYYVDKTGFLRDFLQDGSSKVALFTRPRRFGKSLMLSMMAEFFDITKDSTPLFKGLAISRSKKLCRQWRNQYPVVFLSLKGFFNAASYEAACEQMLQKLQDSCMPYCFLLKSPHVNDIDKMTLKSVMFGQASVMDMQVALYRLCRALSDHYGKPAILLIDEYDTPVSNAEENGFYDTMIKFMQDFLTNSLKENSFLELAVLTGCLRVTRESIFSGLNNLDCFDITYPGYGDAFGFTEAEVYTLLEAFGMADKMDEVREWYDGYHFGNMDDIYCPWGIANYVRDHIKSPDMEPQLYWLNSSANEISRDVFQKTHFRLMESIEKLVDGGCIPVSLQTQMNYGDRYTSADHFWTLMYMTGYLTKASEEQRQYCDVELEQGKTACLIPNKEITRVWETQVRQWLKSEFDLRDIDSFVTAFWKGDTAGAEQALGERLLERLSYYDIQEYTYHVMLVVIFPGPAYTVLSNRETGLGRSDILILDKNQCRAAVIEVKRAAREEDLEARAREALAQIEAKKYDTALRAERTYTEILHWGMAFCGKLCKVVVKKETISLP